VTSYIYKLREYSLPVGSDRALSPNLKVLYPPFEIRFENCSIAKEEGILGIVRMGFNTINLSAEA